MATEVSGRAFLGILKHVKSTRGPHTLAAAVAAGNDDSRAAFELPIRMMGWYSYPSFIGFLHGVERALGKVGQQNFFRELGDVAGIRDLGTVLRVYRTLSSPERLIRACDKVWSSYYRDAGRMEAVAWAPEDTTLRIYDFPDMDPAHCRLMEGWMIATMRAIGFYVNNDAFERKCMSTGAPYHEFHCTWQKRSPPRSSSRMKTADK
ncbi:MAG TPA: hypothetical protein VK550_01395 [Polyangiaceae bacterium]|nr:hypothetical protein [Polyangiaceae bacterium]